MDKQMVQGIVFHKHDFQLVPYSLNTYIICNTLKDRVRIFTSYLA